MESTTGESALTSCRCIIEDPFSINTVGVVWILMVWGFKRLYQTNIALWLSVVDSHLLRKICLSVSHFCCSGTSCKRSDQEP